MSVIDSLSAGYRYLGRRIELLLIPVLIDLVLWVAPRLSIAPLFNQVAAYYRELAQWQEVSPDLRTMFQQVAQMMTDTGQQVNLLDLLVSSSLLQVPSLLLATRPLPTTSLHQITSLFTVFGLSGIFGLLGLLLGVIYMHWLARYLPIGAGSKQWNWRQFPLLLVRHWLKIVLFVLFAFGGMVVVSAIVSLGLMLIALLSPGVGSFVGLLFSGMLLVITIYLYFVPVGLIMDDLNLFKAITQSFRLVRDNFAATLGLVILSRVITWGFTLILERMIIYQPFGTLAAILINAYIGSGLAIGLLVFYRSRLLVAAGQTMVYEL